MAEELGLMWCDDNVFRMMKWRLVGIMGVKLNTLNVNLHDLQFIQLHEDKIGWTRWRREGFTRREYQLSVPNAQWQQPLMEGNHELAAPPKEPKANEIPNPTITHLPTDEQFDLVQQHIIEEWQTIIESEEVRGSVATSFFISKAARRYCHPSQPYQNAFDVLRAILAPQDEVVVRFWDFFKLMSQFGPASTLMLKIHSLLEMATKTDHHWMYFGLVPGADYLSSWAAFDDQESNKLVIRDGKGGQEYVWNLPHIPFGEEFVVDVDGRKYISWEQYFQERPVKEGVLTFHRLGALGFHDVVG
jgi:hypothetical protein